MHLAFCYLIICRWSHLVIRTDFAFTASKWWRAFAHLSFIQNHQINGNLSRQLSRSLWQIDSMQSIAIYCAHKTIIRSFVGMLVCSSEVPQPKTIDASQFSWVGLPFAAAVAKTISPCWQLKMQNVIGKRNCDAPTASWCECSSQLKRSEKRLNAGSRDRVDWCRWMMEDHVTWFMWYRGIDDEKLAHANEQRTHSASHDQQQHEKWNVTTFVAFALNSTLVPWCASQIIFQMKTVVSARDNHAAAYEAKHKSNIWYFMPKKKNEHLNFHFIIALLRRWWFTLPHVTLHTATRTLARVHNVSIYLPIVNGRDNSTWKNQHKQSRWRSRKAKKNEL